jgi:predicted PurR-regulated permease PerM
VDYFVTMLRGVIAALSNTALVIITTMFLLLETTTFHLKVTAAAVAGMDLSRFATMTKEVQRYLAVKTAMSALTGLVIWGWLTFMGVDLPVLWGFVAFLLNFIPMIGSIIAAGPPVLLTAMDSGSLLNPCILAGGYLVVNFGVSYFLEPFLMGRRLRLSPLIVFLSIVIWGWIWGPLGILLSVPLTMIVKILMENSETFRWVAVFLDYKPKAGNLSRNSPV